MKRNVVRQQHVQCDAQCPYICRERVSLGLGEHLGRFERQCTGGCGKEREPIDLFSQAKIADSCPQTVGLVSDEDILWLDVTVDNRRIFAVCQTQPTTNLLENVHCHFYRNQSHPMRSPEFVQTPAGNILHCKVSALHHRS